MMSLRSRSWLFLVTIFVAVIVVAGCDKTATPNNISLVQSESDWAKEEILQQLSELRQELREIKDDITRLDDKLDHLGRVRGNKVKDIDVPIQVRFSDKPILGNNNADIGIIEFTDYQCPYCGRHNQQVMPKMKENLIDTGQVQYVVRDFPLNTHPEAKPAAVAAICAGKQGQYWTMHDAIFKNQQLLSKAVYTQLAHDLNLDINPGRKGDGGIKN